MLSAKALARTIVKLKKLIRNLREHNGYLRHQLAQRKVSEHRARNITAVSGEKFLQKVLRGIPTRRNEGHDLVVGRRKFEVKTARYACVYPESDTCRWSWHNMFGPGGKKRYHRVILLGTADPQHRTKYKDPRSEYVMFDLSPADVRRICKNRAPRLIQLTTNPEKTVSKLGKQLWRHQISSAELRRKYR